MRHLLQSHTKHLEMEGCCGVSRAPLSLPSSSTISSLKWRPALSLFKPEDGRVQGRGWAGYSSHCGH